MITQMGRHRLRNRHSTRYPRKKQRPQNPTLKQKTRRNAQLYAQKFWRKSLLKPEGADRTLPR